MTENNSFKLGYDYDAWQGYGQRDILSTDISLKTNSHMILCGMSGSGKSYALIWAENADSCFHARSKVFLRGFYAGRFLCVSTRECTFYYPYKKSLEALECVYTILHKRQSGENKDRYAVTLIWDEYMANILALQGEDKKKAADVMNKVSEILMLGRSLGVRFICSCQRPDAKAFPDGSRLNYGIIMILGAPMRSIYEMLMPKEYIDMIEDRQFERGEGVLLLQGSDLRFVKIPTVRNVKEMQEICIRALS